MGIPQQAKVTGLAFGEKKRCVVRVVRVVCVGMS